MEHTTYNKKLKKSEKHENCSMFHVPCSMKQGGFSLIELVVVLTIFVIIIGVTINIFISMVQNQKRLLEEQELLNQTSFAFEYMSKALRMAVEDESGSCLVSAGRIYVLTHCPNGTLQACNGVKFINSLDNNACQEFFLDESVNPINSPLREIKNNSTAQNLLSSKLIIKYGRFIIDGNKALRSASISDILQPRVTFLLDVLTASNNSEKIIQTTISQRNLGESTLPPSGPSCGDGICTLPENLISCFADCSTPPPSPFCGDGTCTPPENSVNCFADCGAPPPPPPPIP